MPDDIKVKPRIKVEEIEEAPEEVTENVKDKTSEEASASDTTALPKVVSFSQLDSAPPAPAEEKRVSELLPETKTVKAASTEKEKPSNENEQISSDEVKEWLKEVRPDTSKENEKGRGPKAKIVVLIVLILLVLGAVVGGVLYFQKGVKEEGQEGGSMTTPESTPTSSPVPTQVEEEVDLKMLSVSVLNGSGVTGEAGKVKSLLVEGGFAEDKVAAGNADKTNYEETTVSLKKDLSQKVVEAIKASLADEYAVTVSEGTLEENSTYDVVIIVGSKAAE